MFMLLFTVADVVGFPVCRMSSLNFSDENTFCVSADLPRHLPVTMRVTELNCKLNISY